MRVSSTASTGLESLLSSAAGFIIESIFTEGKAFATLSEVLAEAVAEVVFVVVSPCETLTDFKLTR